MSQDYEGWCWPGASFYPDFLNAEAREYFAEQYRLDKYQVIPFNNAMQFRDAVSL